MHTHTQPPTHTHIHPHAHPHPHTHVHTDMQTQTDTQTHARTHAHTHTHTRHQQISEHWKDGPSGTHTHREREGERAMGSAPGMPAHVKALLTHFPKCIYIRLSTSLMPAEATTVALNMAFCVPLICTQTIHALPTTSLLHHA